MISKETVVQNVFLIVFSLKHTKQPGTISVTTRFMTVSLSRAVTTSEQMRNCLNYSGLKLNEASGILSKLLSLTSFAAMLDQLTDRLSDNRPECFVYVCVDAISWPSGEIYSIATKTKSRAATSHLSRFKSLITVQLDQSAVSAKRLCCIA